MQEIDSLLKSNRKNNVFASAQNDFIFYFSDEETPIQKFCHDKGSGNYIHPVDCEQFIMCSNGYTHEFKCPAGMRYNPDLKICDWKYKVLCIAGKLLIKLWPKSGKLSHRRRIIF